ncbi:hypothetical protein L6252_01505 [Candidatus Parcubacteria bacterium]|nr:hypothetical protein [Candidatus Parcubacteria bacterium]
MPKRKQKFDFVSEEKERFVCKKQNVLKTYDRRFLEHFRISPFCALDICVVKKRRVLISDPARLAVLEGLNAVKRGEVSAQFDSAQGAVSFLK